MEYLIGILIILGVITSPDEAEQLDHIDRLKLEKQQDQLTQKDIAKFIGHEDTEG